VLIDVALAAWMTFLSQYFVGNWPDPLNLWRDIDPLGRILLLIVHVPLVFRRRFPVGVLIAVCTAAAAYLTLGYYHSVTTFGLALALYSVAAHRPPRVSWPPAAAVGLVLLWGSRLAEPGMQAVGAGIALAIAAVGWGFGDGTRRLAERGTRLKVLTEQLEQEQEEQARQAVTREQGRIARELHDIVAHHMSVISVQAGLGRYVFDTDPQTARRALGVIGEAAHEAMGEMRRMLTVLRVSADDPAADAAPFDAAAGLGQLDELLHRVRASGAKVELVVTGVPVQLHPGLDLCVYRVIQESLTNVLKHADPPHATVEIRWYANDLSVRISDAGAPKPPGHGLGIIGMRERARIYGGTLQARPRPEGGFEVRLALPIREIES
jgi:signal transduction histidine kinase